MAASYWTRIPLLQLSWYLKPTTQAIVGHTGHIDLGLERQLANCGRCDTPPSRTAHKETAPEFPLTGDKPSSETAQDSSAEVPSKFHWYDGLVSKKTSYGKNRQSAMLLGMDFPSSPHQENSDASSGQSEPP